MRDNAFSIDLLEDIIRCLRAVEQVSLVRQLTILRYLNTQGFGGRNGESVKLDNQAVERILKKNRAARSDFTDTLSRLQEKRLKLQGRTLEEISAALETIDSNEPGHEWYEMLKTEERRGLEELLGARVGMADD